MESRIDFEERPAIRREIADLNHKISGITENLGMEPETQAEESNGTDLSAPLKRPPGVSDNTWRQMTGDIASPCWDIFSNYAEPLVKEGISIYFQIFKNGQYQQRAEWPMNWDVIQEQFGAGTYNVRVCVAGTGRYLARQTRSIAAPVKSQTEIKETVVQLQHQNSEAQAQMIGLIREQSERTERLLKEKLTQPASQDSTLLVEIMKMNQAQAQAVQAAQMESMRLMQTQMMEGMRMLAESVKTFGASKKEEGPGAFELMKMISDAQERGKAEAREIFEMIEERAEKRASEQGGSDKSTLDKILEAALPKVIDGLEAGSKMRAMQAGMPIAPSQPQANPIPPQAQPLRPTQMKTVQAQVVQPENPGGTPMKDRVFNTLAPHLQPWIVGGKKPKDAALDAKKILDHAGLSHAQVVANVSENDVAEKARSLGIPSFAVDWLKSFYGEYRNLSENA